MGFAGVALVPKIVAIGAYSTNDRFWIDGHWYRLVDA
jgi:hypothetical protein